MSAEWMNVADFPTYDEYKDSGVEWLGEVPKGWELLPNKFIFKQKKNLVGKRSKNYVLLSLTLNGVIKRNMENPEGKFPAEFDTYQEVKDGDFVFCLFDVEETPRTVGLSKFDGMITGAYTIFESQPSFNKQFLYYFYLNLDVDKRLKPLYKGLRNTISKDVFYSFKTFVPTLTEQTLIAQFLDQKTALIDQAIAIKEQQIRLLNERKQIIIQQAVTQGLNPNAPMKDSGVEWIGQIPEHWEVKKLKYLVKVLESGVSVNASESENAKGSEVGVLKTSAVYTYSFNSQENKKVFKNEIHRVSCSVKAGSIIISRMNAPDLVGASGYVNEDYKNLFLPDRLWQARFYDETNLTSKFMSKVFITSMYRKKIESVATGSSPSMKNISKGDFLNLYVPIPLHNEQIEIIDYIDRQELNIDKYLLNVGKHIQALKEYKTTLINSAVTGKIKITEAMLTATTEVNHVE